MQKYMNDLARSVLLFFDCMGNFRAARVNQPDKPRLLVREQLSVRADDSASRASRPSKLQLSVTSQCLLEHEAVYSDIIHLYFLGNSSCF